MSARTGMAIWYDQNDRRFYFDGHPATITELGMRMAQSLIEGQETISFGPVTVTVNYVAQMLRLTSKTGDFLDRLDNTRDHDFNPNVPTPGLRFRRDAEACCN